MDLVESSSHTMSERRTQNWTEHPFDAWKDPTYAIEGFLGERCIVRHFEADSFVGRVLHTFEDQDLQKAGHDVILRPEEGELTTIDSKFSLKENGYFEFDPFLSASKENDLMCYVAQDISRFVMFSREQLVTMSDGRWRNPYGRCRFKETDDRFPFLVVSLSSVVQEQALRDTIEEIKVWRSLHAN